MSPKLPHLQPHKQNIKELLFLQLRKVGFIPIIFIIIALGFGLIIVKEVPPFWAFDESAHFSRAYQVSEGQFLPQKLPDKNYGGYVPVSIVQLEGAVDQNLSVITPGPVLDRNDFQHSSLQEAAAGQLLDRKSKVAYDFPGSAVYTPLAYIAPATGILVCRLANCSLDHAILAARTFNLIGYVGVVAFALWLLRARRIQWLIFVVSLLPMTIFQAASVSIDGPIISLCLLLFAIVMKAFNDRKLSLSLISLLVFIAVCIPLIKISYGFLDISLIPVAMILFSNKKRALLYSLSCIGLIALLTLVWLFLSRGPGKMISSLQTANGSAHSFVSIRKQSQFLINRPLEFGHVIIRTVVYMESIWITSTIGAFALNYVTLPLTAVVYGYVILFCAASYARDEIIRYSKQALVLGLLAILTALSILGTLYLTFTVVGSPTVAGVQGRYFIPLIPFFLVAVASLIPIRVSMSPRVPVLLFSLSSCVLLLSGVIYYGLATY